MLSDGTVLDFSVRPHHSGMGLQVASAAVRSGQRKVLQPEHFHYHRARKRE